MQAISFLASLALTLAQSQPWLPPCALYVAAECIAAAFVVRRWRVHAIGLCEEGGDEESGRRISGLQGPYRIC